LGFPRICIHFTLQAGCQNSQRHAGRTSLKGRHLLSLLSSDFSGVHVIEHRAERLPPYGAGNVSPGIHPLQPGIRFFQPSIPAHNSHAMA